jgi:hypothetical protein
VRAHFLQMLFLIFFTKERINQTRWWYGSDAGKLKDLLKSVARAGGRAGGRHRKSPVPFCDSIFSLVRRMDRQTLQFVDFGCELSP